ncbi:lyase family protein [Rothia halotolerans]|uniref:lyase family protein n=1 Tax=Rothia halotolerans TaxID=405770 RepID=UPI001EDCC899|nr:lyase family protein [Rothia halotolerans]
MDFLVPGGQRAHDVVGPAAFLDRLVEAEAAWVRAQAAAGALEGSTARALAERLGTGREYDAAGLAAAAEGGGNPVIGLVAAMRERAGDSAAGGDPAWRPLVHRGLTSQDVMDTALMGMLARAVERTLDEVLAAGDAVARLAAEHIGTPMLARTLTQPALPTTFGARAGSWLAGLTGVVPLLRRAREQAPYSLGGAAGTLAALEEWERPAGVGAAELAGRLGAAWGRELCLAGEPLGVWHTRRGPLLRMLEPLAETAAACARIAGDVALSSRAEIAELSEPAAQGRGGSSAMPHKRNPVLSVLIRRSGLSAGAALGAAAQAGALAVEERSDTAWHLEWEPARAVARHGIVAASLTRELAAGLEVHREAMRENLAAHGPAGSGSGQAARTAGQAVRDWSALRRDAAEDAAPQRPTTRESIREAKDR